ncbi:MAG: FG-GAP repeat protein [Planctomycetes bacterium]|nr:FG-GAP repeat protein [Planctomycetota bacterium]
MRSLPCTLLLLLGTPALAQAPREMLAFPGDASGATLGHAVAFVGDWNGDGRTETAFGVPGRGRVDVVRPDGVVLRSFTGGFAPGSSFGQAIASVGDLNGDGVPELLVGAPLFSSGSGGVALLSGANGATIWSQFGTQGQERLGWAVAGLGDLDGDGFGDFAYSALQSFSGGLGFVVVRSGRTQALLRSHVGSFSGEGFGYALARAGDVDGDGVQDYVAGAPWASRRAFLGGEAIAYSGANGSRLASQSGVIDFEEFGHAVGALDADWSGDGKSDWIVGAPGNDEGAGYASGSLFVLGYNASSSTAPVVQRFDGALGDELGSAIAGGGDVNGDGARDVAAAAVPAGVVRLWSGKPGHALLDELRQREANDRFGFSLALGGDLDANSYAEIAIGAPWDRATSAGRGYVVDLGWQQPTVILALQGDAPGRELGRHVAYVGDLDGDLASELALSIPGSNRVDLYRRGGLLLRSLPMGVSPLSSSSIAAAGDVNGDGVPDVLVGNAAEGTGGNHAGAVRVFSGADGSVLHAFFGGPEEYLGFSVAGLGDLDGDGYDDVAAGAPEYPDPHAALPTNYVRVWSGRTGSVLRTLTSTQASRFGYDIARAGDLDDDGVQDLLVGAPFADLRATDGGAVFGYSGRTFLQIATQSGNTFQENFGLSVAALDDDWDGDGRDDYVAGSFQNDDGAGFQAGSLFVINRFGNVIRRFDGASGQHFGLQVTGGGDVDGDGKMEVAASSENLDQIWVFSGAAGHERLRSFSGHGFFPVLDLAGDFDGDGYADLAVGCAAAAQLAGRAWVYDFRGAGTPARALASGRACAASNGHLPHATLEGRPALGAAIALGLRAALPNAPALLQAGTPIALPLDPLGAPSCTLYSYGDVLALASTTDAEGRATLPPLTVPLDPGLIGARFDAQWAVLDAAANSLGLAFSTRLVMILGS